jgi:RNA polymerase sigma-70 factor, ECF subfamily
MGNQALAMKTGRDGGEVLMFPASAGEVDIGTLFDEHAKYLARVVTRLTGSRQAAEDVVQEVFIVAHRRKDDLKSGTNIRAWLYRVAVNHVRHHRRSKGRYNAFIGRYERHPQFGADGSPEAAYGRVESAKQVQDVVLLLSEKQREVFVLYELEGLEGAEIASVLGIRLNTVWSRLRLARNRFRTLWTEKQGGEP